MKILKIAGAVLGAIVVIAVLYLSFADFSKYQPEIEAAVTEATGREFRINGDLEIKALPSPYARMENVTLANAPWADEPNMLEVGEMSVKLGLWSLLFRPIVIHDFQLHDVNVLLETNEDGKSNLDFDVPQEEPPPEEEEEESGSTESPIHLRNAGISNVRVTLRQPESDEMTFALENLTVLTDEDDRQQVEVAAQWLELPIALSGTVDDNRADMTASFGDVQYRSVTEHAGSEADLDITVSMLADVGALIEVEGLPAEDLTVAGNVALRGDSVVVTDFVVGVGTARLTINGELDGAASEARLDVAADVPSLAVLSPDLPDIPLTGTAKLALAESKLGLDPFELRFGESDIAGSLSAEGGDVPGVTLQARSSMIDLRPFAAEEEAGGEEAAEEPAADEGDESPYLFKDEPLPMDTLQGFSADIDVTIDRLQQTTSHFEDFRLIATANDGVLELDNSFRGGRGGEFENHVELNASGSSADLVLKASASGLKLGAFSGGDVPDDLVPASDLKLDITARGGSPRQMASSVNGGMLFTQGPGRVKNDLIGKISGDMIAELFSALNPFSKEEEFSNWDCTIFALDFESGEGEITGFLLQGEKIMVVGGGEIDLNTEKLNIEFNTKPREGVGVSADMFVTPFVALSGTLADPGVGLNAKGALLEGGLAVMTGGLSFLYKGVMDRATATADQCEKTMAEVAEAREGSED